MVGRHSTLHWSSRRSLGCEFVRTLLWLWLYRCLLVLLGIGVSDSHLKLLSLRRSRLHRQLPHRQELSIFQYFKAGFLVKFLTETFGCIRKACWSFWGTLLWRNLDYGRWYINRIGGNWRGICGLKQLKSKFHTIFTTGQPFQVECHVFSLFPAGLVVGLGKLGYWQKYFRKVLWTIQRPR